MDQRDVWNKIAPYWKKLRSKPINELKEFVDLNPENSKVLDIGCGTGRNFDLLKRFNLIGMDFSVNMLKGSGYEKVVCADAEQLPFKDNSFDALVSISLLNCVEGASSAVDEMARVLKNNGNAFVSVWSSSAKLPKDSEKEGDRFIVPWRSSDKQFCFYRRYRLFEEQEIKELLKKKGFSVKELDEKSFKSLPMNISFIATLRG